MKTVLITGCSSGYGLETARHFLAQGWNVVATMRTPREDLLPRSERLRILPLDVTRAQSIAAAMEAALPPGVAAAGIGGVALFLASDDARYITGNTLFADGGGHINGVAWAPQFDD